MNKILAVILFPVIWASMYLYRIFGNIIETVLEIVTNLFIFPLSSLWLLITFPVVMIWEIPVGLVVTFVFAIATSAEIFRDELDVASALKNCFSKGGR